MISKWIDRFCYKHPNFGLPNLMKYIVLSNVVVFLMDLFTNNFISNLLFFHYKSILSGQVWRLVTFILVPSVSGTGSAGFGLFTNVFFFAMTSFFYYWIGSTLEHHMGTARFSLFYLLGIVFNILFGLISHASVNMYYINMSMFFSFATLYPDTRVFLYGLIPLKIKWLAWLDAAFFAYDIAYYMSAGYWQFALLPILAILNYFLFFGRDLLGSAKAKKERMAYRHSAQAVNFKKAQKDIQSRKGYLHKCAVCGVTDTDNPNMEFRYCSKCNGYYCYCMEHINSHVHIQ